MSATRDFLLERPHFLARAIYYSIIGLLCMIVLMSWLATINIAVSGNGVIATKQETVEIYTPDKMMLRNIFVEKGQEIIKYDLMAILTDDVNREEIRAPIDGIVAFVSPWLENTLIKNDTPMFVIVPFDNQLVAKIEIPSSTMKPVRLNQTAKLKIDAYPFRNYGVWTGRVIYISPTTRKNSANIDVYDLTIEIDQAYAGNKPQTLLMGQSLSADIVIDRISIFDYLLNFIRGVNYYL